MISSQLRFHFVLVLSAMSLLLSCSEFSNQKKEIPGSPVRPTTGGAAKVPKANPFPDGFDPNAGEFSEYKMIASIGLNVIAPATTRLRLQTELMIAEIDSAYSALTEERGAHNELKAAQEAWRRVMLSYHFLEGAPVGPLSDLTFKQSIYSWPGINLCGIDKQVVARSKSVGAPVAGLFYTLKGLLALEYLLFESSLESKCNLIAAPNEDVVLWIKNTDNQKRLDRLNFARFVAADVFVQVEKLESDWAPKGTNFSKLMVDGIEPFATLRTATTALSHALFSIEVLKDRRLGKPLGLHKDCLNAERKCPEDIEHLWSKISLEAIDAQMNGFEAVFFGRSKNIDGFGFDDFLRTLGRADVAERFRVMLNHFREHSKAAQALGTLEEAVLSMDVEKCKATTAENNFIPVCALFQSVRQINTKLKTEFLSALSLSAPPSYQGDSD